MRKLTTLVTMLATLGLSSLAAADHHEKLSGDYVLYLYFGDSTPFEDTFQLKLDKNDQLAGDMQVPNDFVGPLLDIETTADNIKFDLFVPTNAARPTDRLFRYVGVVHGGDATIRLAGHVEIVAVNGIATEPQYVASFVAFKRN